MDIPIRLLSRSIRSVSLRAFRLGLIINPYAGIGGALALKGSDGKDIREQALAMGAEKKANERARLALEELVAESDRIEIFTAGGEMGESLSSALGFTTHVVYRSAQKQTEAIDTQQAAQALVEQQIDLLLFAGGDGTARNIFDQVDPNTTVLGIPAGCKIHSGVYAITPKSAGRVAAMLVRGEIVSLHEAEIKDIDENLFRQGKVQAKYYGEMKVPTELRYVQAVKMGGKESDELVLADIAAHVIEEMQSNPEILYVMGSGSTVAAVMEELGLPNTLLGVDCVLDQQLIQSDVTADQLLQLVQRYPTKLIITLIGGQGHVFGRGNQQLSPAVIRQVGKDNIIVLATKTKIQSLQGRALLTDTGDAQLDEALTGMMTVITGYKDSILYPMDNALGED